MQPSEQTKVRPPDSLVRDVIRIATFAFTVQRILEELERKHGIDTKQLIEVGRECVIAWRKARRVSRRRFDLQIATLEATASASRTRH